MLSNVQRKRLEDYIREENFWPVIEEASHNNGYAQHLLKEAGQPLPPLQERFVDEPAYWDNLIAHEMKA